MAGIGALIAAIGIIGIIYGLFMRAKVGRISGAPFVKTGEAASNPGVAGPKGAVSVEGNVECPQPLVSPCTGTPCLHYELKVVGSWKEGETKKSKDYLHEKRGAAFAINDGSGPVRVRADDGGDFEPFDKTFDQKKKEGFFADLKSAVGKGQPIMFGQYAFENPPMSKADTFECVEHVLKIQPRLYANGKLEGGVIQAPGWRSLILDARGREHVLGSSGKAAKIALIVGGGAIVAGTAVGLVGNFLMSDSRQTSSTTASTPSTTAATSSAAATSEPAGAKAAAPAGAKAAGAKPTAAPAAATPAPAAKTSAAAPAATAKPAAPK